VVSGERGQLREGDHALRHTEVFNLLHARIDDRLRREARGSGRARIGISGSIAQAIAFLAPQGAVFLLGFVSWHPPSRQLA
jgi:hypothetical protein